MLTRMMNDFAPLFRLQNEMNRWMENFFEDAPAVRPYGSRYPALNTWEDGDHAYVEAELPGMSIDDLDVSVLGNQVRIAGERRIGPKDGEPAQDDKATWLVRERAQGAFAKELTLPWQVDAEKVEAHLRDGVLTVKLPKTESAKPKKVKLLTA